MKHYPISDGGINGSHIALQTTPYEFKMAMESIIFSNEASRPSISDQF
jgi:hypothetical protein